MRYFRLFFLSLCFGVLLAVPVQAEGLLELDDFDFYSLDAPLLGSVSLLADGAPTYFTYAPGGTVDYGGTRTENYGSSAIKIGPYTIAANADVNIRNAALGAIMLNANNVKYTDYAVSQALGSIDFSWVGWSGLPEDTLMERLDLIEAHWKTLLQDTTVFRSVLDQLHDDLHDDLSAILKFQTDLWGDPASFSGLYIEGGRLSWHKYTSFSSFLQQSQNLLVRGLWMDGDRSYLNYLGNLVVSDSPVSLADITRWGFLGLSRNITDMSDRIHADIMGNSWYAYHFLVPSDDGGLEESLVFPRTENLQGLLITMGTYLQNPLAKLAYVWADDDDIRIADKNQPVKDEIEEDFLGDGDAAVSVSSIKDVAGISSGVRDTFSGAGSPGDTLSVLSDSGNYGFFSQEVMDMLEPPLTAAASLDDADSEAEFWEQFVFDESTGLYLPKNSIFDAAAYLEGLS